jgi:ABC-type antimicrobial peptide transport system permease subunit
VSAVLRYALARLVQRRGRALLFALGVAAASAMVAAAATVAYSFSTGFDRAAARADLPDVTAQFDRVPLRVAAARIEALPNLRAVAYRLEISHRVVTAGADGSSDGTVIAVRGNPRGYAVVSGSDLSGSPGEAVVEAGLARAWHVGAGGVVSVDGHPFRIVGEAVAPDTVAYPLATGPRVWLPYDDARRLTGAEPNSVDEVLLWVRDPKLLDVTLAQARAASFGVGGLEFVTREGVRALISQAGGIVIALLVAFSVVAVGAAGAMLAASAAADVQRRVESIGVLRAIGASPAAIAAAFALEAAAVAAVAATAGALVGWLVVAGPCRRLLDSLNELMPGASLALVLACAVVAIVALVAAAAAWPAWRAARKPAVETMRGADVAQLPERARLRGGGTFLLGVRLTLARPVRAAATVGVLAASGAVVLLILAIATLLSQLDTNPATVGRRYQLTVSAPPTRLSAIRRIPGVSDAAARYEIDAADSFDLGEIFQLIAFDEDHTRFEAPPLAEGRRIANDREVEVGLGLAQALELHPGATLAAQLPSGAEVRFRVAGVVRALPNHGRVAYVEPRRLLAAAPFLSSTIAVRLEPGANAAAVRRAAAATGAVASSSGGLGGDAVQGWATRNSGFVSVLVALLRAVAVLDGVVCLYVLVQMLALTAQERRSAVAVLRALGASRAQVTAVFAGSALVVVALAAPTAALAERGALGPVVSRLAAAYVSLPLGAGAVAVAIVALGGVATALAAAAYVARAAVRERVVAGLRTE